MRIEHNLIIETIADAERYAAVIEVSGSVYIRAANASLPALAQVSGKVHIRAANASLPALAQMSGYKIATGDTSAARITAVAVAALATPESLEMDDWHTCETTHCIGGWGIHLAGEVGRELEAEVGESAAATILLGKEAAMYFNATPECAREWLQTKLPRAV